MHPQYWKLGVLLDGQGSPGALGLLMENAGRFSHSAAPRDEVDSDGGEERSHGPLGWQRDSGGPGRMVWCSHLSSNFH